MRRISFCVAHKNRTDNLRRLGASLAEMHDLENVELVIADFGSTDGLKLSVLPAAAMSCKIVALSDKFFNRSRGLNAAVAASSAAGADIVAFMDADMLVPQDYTRILRNIVQPGTCYFPICYSLHRNKPAAYKDSSKHANKANGWWRDEGAGMAALTRADFDRIGCWNEEIGRSYGKEDGDFCRRAGDTLVRVRERCIGLFHVWHPMSADYRERYHVMRQPAAKKYKSIRRK